ncbi:nicotinate-nucleotide--dimethylbenzimidazole phosphoribosyltransferase [candidate division WOR-1 bacterium RIFCSPLOWO2_02_FULL_46_20]|uniref:Nicotinate-nucleotide--dimethylbenzimidazole phosphoribosyltransferase n=2 Tax=Saganbacteria TaxID=1703751 RepID=A0A1F4RCZ6_UNCSA|nr:MAG: nicotinate-nucleotide--dimethylbenzimidazole phosphoribosyltransferase [candidate division WOR-1 bacterium RIFCSPHIGHO2_02_FULL_45_12]OGC06065.1 MAG: nicotinate-nucleotide--dimethylbenzimidazole phosphoribosyltransferase [candidate division WOR-1 bacterium RIFCSPLOWO2_02_FULL_46_20]OGC09903.1 MAG: nicotinate-nucleotide--dimethylbenzimidazole phosphoribosyltransferase [candidate division WOR-1 bacterium RIFCSPLOWO2_12_FULL_45_9]
MKKLEAIMEKIKPIRIELAEPTQKRLDNLTKPRGSLGRLEELAKQIVCITGREEPKIKHKIIITMAGDHGVVEEGVSAYPQEVTPQMVYNFLRGGAGINVLARHVGARVVVVDMGVAGDLDPQPELINKKVAYGTKNMVTGPAMTREQAIQSIEAGIEVVEEELKNGVDIIGTGDMGIGNTTPSSAIVAAITGADVAKVTGRGTGIDDENLKKKIKAIEKALEVNKPKAEDGIDVLAKVGGFEIGGMAGVMLASAANRIPVFIDGFISGAAALVAVKLEPKVKDYLIASHCSVEAGHIITLEWMGLKPLLDFNLRLGEGTGAALGISIAEAGIRILTEMATFGDAGVSEAIA